MLQSAFQWGGEELARLIPLGVKSNLARTFADGEVTWKWEFTALQIVLNLSKTVADVLLNFDLDQCAMGFNGTPVLMLPRCARALETGYTVFCSDLVCGS